MRLFLYGTLIAGSGNRVATMLHSKLKSLGAAQVRGRLYAVADPQGWYPALLEGRGMVRGALYEALPGFGAADLAAVDAYEDCDRANVAGSLYRRVMLPLVDGGKAWGYRFAQPLPRGSQRIAGGDFAAWLGRTGRQPFGVERGAAAPRQSPCVSARVPLKAPAPSTRN